MLATIDTNLDSLRAEPHNHEVLTTIRRGFHTLKGSGRMVGLKELGEAAWSAEQVMNQWLRLEQDATPALHQFIGDAHRAAASLGAATGSRRRQHMDASALFAQAEMLKSGGEEAPPAGAPPVVPERGRPAGGRRIPPAPPTRGTDPYRRPRPVAHAVRHVPGRGAAAPRNAAARAGAHAHQSDAAAHRADHARCPHPRRHRRYRRSAGESMTSRAIWNTRCSVWSRRIGRPSADQSEVLNSAASVLEGMVKAVADKRRPQPLTRSARMVGRHRTCWRTRSDGTCKRRWKKSLL
ncbi:MAG: Hpt domain-containing protein [Comamonadaceae bacterium]|nr:Hpt domain-containing protein [Comamonadaceae bacterium]